MEFSIMDILNLIFLGLVPLFIKFLNDLNKLYLKLTEHKKEIEYLKEDIKDLRGCLYELKKIIMQK